MEPPIHARNLILCRSVAYDPNDPQAPYILENVVTYFRPTDDYGYPYCMETLWVYTEVYGNQGATTSMC